VSEDMEVAESERCPPAPTEVSYLEGGRRLASVFRMPHDEGCWQWECAKCRQLQRSSALDYYEVLYGEAVTHYRKAHRGRGLNKPRAEIRS